MSVASEFIDQYIDTMLWSTSMYGDGIDENCDASYRDAGYTVEDLSPKL
jgi:hypothetical protein